MLISQKCFKDKCLYNIIRRNNSLGKCSFSNLENTYIIDMEKLYQDNKDMISEIFTLYEYNMVNLSNRKNIKIPYDSLLNLLQSNWNLFDLENVSNDEANNILLYWVNKVKPYKNYHMEDLIKPFWCDIRYVETGYFVKEDWDFINLNMKYNYRYNLQSIPVLNFNINDLLSANMFNAIAFNNRKGTSVYRGRIKDKDIIFKRKEMLIPPASVKSIGRANPVGINYLYAADKIETVMAEIRAWKKSKVSIAKLEFKKDMCLVDFSIGEITDSIFDSGSYFNFDVLERIQCLEIEALIFKELSRPINPREVDMEYIFTQYICEKVKSLGYDGIIFKSSLCDGTNYILFSDKDIKLKSIEDYTVKDIQYHFWPYT